MEKINIEMKSQIKIAADIIKKAINDRVLIIIRHHADCDGYCGALALEEVIQPIVKNENAKPWQKYKRLPMKTPYYDYSDAIRDLESFKDTVENNKEPLLILIDNGSGEEDIQALKRLSLYPIKIIILDHHIFTAEAKKYCDTLINSREYYKDGSFTAGMISYEVAKIIGNPKKIYPSLSGIGDKSNEEILKPYLEQSEKNRDFLEKLSMCVDFEAHHLRFTESDSIYDLFNENQEKTMKIILSELEQKYEEYKIIGKQFAEKERIKNLDLYTINIDEITSFNDYPTPGKVVGIIHRLNKGPRITLGIAKDFITFRIDETDFSIEKLLKNLKEKIPCGKINGGGHDYAGTIKFIPLVKDEVLKRIKEYINKN